MKGYEKIAEIINQAHKQTTHPTVALIAASAQALRSDGCAVTIGSGESSHEAVSSALAKEGRMKNWVVVVSRMDVDGNRITPQVMDQQMMRTFLKTGMNVVFYVQMDGDWEYYTPTT